MRRGFSHAYATPSEIEDLAQTCESFTKKFPIYFPGIRITRKMHVLSCVAPRQIREQKKYFKMLKVEQMGEYLHCKFNQLSRQLAPIRNKEQKYFSMIKEYENSLYTK